MLSIAAATNVTLLNVSCDPTRELYREFKLAFARHWKKKTGETVTAQQSHGGSSERAAAFRAVPEPDTLTRYLSSSQARG